MGAFLAHIVNIIMPLLQTNTMFSLRFRHSLFLHVSLCSFPLLCDFLDDLIQLKKKVKPMQIPQYQKTIATTNNNKFKKKRRQN